MVAGAHRMSSPQYPARLLFVITTLSCTLTGCVSKQASSPEMADSSASDPTRDSFLAATDDVALDSSETLAINGELLEPGAAPDVESINAILDEMLAGHQALKVRKALEVDPGLSSSESVQPASNDLALVSDTLSAQSELLARTVASAAETSAPDEAPALIETLPRIEPTTEMIRSLMSSAARSDAPLKQHLALAMLMAWVSPEKPFEPAGLAELTEEERAIVSIVYDHFKSLGNDLDEGGGEADLLTALTGIIDAVEDQSPFQISRMELCSWVRDFGDVDVIEPLTFSPKERPRFIWYVELDGVSPIQSATTGEWAHEFDVKVEVLTKDTGIPVISPVEDRVRYASSSRLRDLFLRNILEIPEDLQFDWYTTKVTITEVASGIRSQKSLDLLWVPNLAAGEAHFLRQAAVDE